MAQEAPQPEPRFVPFGEALTYANIPDSTMRDWIRRGYLPAYRIGPRLLQIDLNDIDRLRRRVPAVGAPMPAEAATLVPARRPARRRKSA